jgi:flagellar hook protein FlgE
MSSVLPIALSGMNAASQRLQTAAGRIATSSGGDLEGAIVDLMISRIGLAANAKVAQSAAQTLNTLLDIKV